MDLFQLLEQQLEKQNVGTLTLGRSKRFREIFFDREAIYTVGNEFAGKVDFECLLGTRSVWKRIDLPSLEAIILSTDLRHNLLPQVLFDQGLLEEKELERLAQSQLMEEIIDLLSHNTGSFHYQEGRVPEYLLQYDAIHTRIPVKLDSILAELQRRTERLAESRALIPSAKEIFVLTERGMAYRQTSPDDFVLQRVLGMIDGFRDLETVLNDSYFFEYTVIENLGQALKNGYIKKTIHPELKGISTRNLSPEEAKKLLPHFKNAVKYGVDELAARERLAVIYEKVHMIDDAVIQYNFIGDTLFQMRKSAKAVKAYQRALALKPGEILLTDKITRIYLKTADQELAAGNTSVAIQLLEGAVTLRPDDSDTSAKLVALLKREGRLKEMISLGEGLMLAARKSRMPDAAICVLRGCLDLQRDNPAIRRRLINLYLDFEMRQEAANEMEVLAYSYLERSQYQKAEEILEKIRLLPGLKYDTRALQRAIRQRTPSEDPRFNKVAALRLAVLVLAIVLSFYQGWSFIAWSSIQRGNNLAYALAPGEVDVDELVASLDSDERNSLVVRPGSREARFRALIERYDRFVDEFPVSLFVPIATSFREWARQSADSLASLRAEKKKALIAEAEAVVRRNGDFARVKTLLTPLLDLEKKDRFRQRAEKLLGKAESQYTERSSAAELFASAVRLEKAKNYREASNRYRALLRAYPRSSWARKVRIPILIDSVPRGAQVFEADNLKGSTPFAVQLAPGEATLLTARRPGSLPTKGEWISSDEFVKNEWSAHVFLLAREPSKEDRVFKIEEESIASPPAFGRDYIFWGDNRGRLNWGSLASGAQEKIRVSDDPLTLLGSPTVTPGAVYSRWSDGTVVRYMALEGEPADWTMREFRSGRIITTELMAVEDLVLFGSGGKLKVVDGSGIRTVYKPSSRFSPRVLAPHSVAGQILVGSAGGSVAMMEVGETFRRRWGGTERVCESDVKTLATSGNVVAASDGISIVFLDGRDGRRLGKELSTGRRHCIHAGAGRIFRTTPSRGFEVFDIESRELLPVPELFEAIASQNEILRMSELPGALAIILDGGPGASSETERRVLICDVRTLEPLIVARTATPVSHVVGTDDYIAIVESDRITVFKR